MNAAINIAAAFTAPKFMDRLVPIKHWLLVFPMPGLAGVIIRK
ncbi:hypothetical protein OK016_08755 [Vibrio chagasii]|nr:hypothetical protein [Vibrio chagasii]